MSPSGIEAFRKKQQQKSTQKAKYGGGDGARPNYFGILDKQYAIVRFLEQGDEITFTDAHRVPVEGRRWPLDFVCLDFNDDGTPCPACQSSNDDVRKRSTRGYFNVIWREGPVYKLDDRGWVEKGPDKKPIIAGRADGIFLWKASWTVTEMLIEKDGKFKGLTSRDWEIKRTGSEMQDTVYYAEPADPDGGPQPMLLPDLALAEKKYDLKELTAPLSYEEFATVLNSGSFSGGPQSTMDRSDVAPSAGSVFQGDAPPVRSSAFQRG